MIRVEKRLPFGFVGMWGNVYKVCKYEDDNGDVEYNKRNYIRMDMPVQFRDAFDKTHNKTKIATDLSADNVEDLVETTDAYYDNEAGGYSCVVSVGDILRFGDSWWNVKSVQEKNFFMPQQHTIYAISLLRVNREVINVKK